MRHLPKLLILLMISMIPMQVLGNNFSGTFMPDNILLNELSSATFDPENAEGQPHLTTFTIQNISSKEHTLGMKIELSWNGKKMPVTEFQSRRPIAPSERLFLTNVDLFTNASSANFVRVSGKITFDDIMKIDPTLKQALLSGYFPDGVIRADISLRSVTSGPYEPPSTFTITVKNTGTITLLSPGQKLGSTPPQVSMKPVSFAWNAVNTGFNKAWITIKEFPQTVPPTQNSVALTGSLFYETPDEMAAQDLINNFMFAEYLPFNDGSYYAWQITLDRFTEDNPKLPPSRRPDSASSLKSDWYVFQYVTDGGIVGNMSELKALLMSLDNADINTLIAAGFDPAGNVILNGRNYSGHEAIRVLQEIITKDIDITVGN